MVVGAYRDFLVALAGTAGSLTGLLFVAISVSPKVGLAPGPAVIRQVREAAALLAFVNTLAVSLFGLVPGGSVRYPAVSLGVIGLLFVAAGVRSIFSAAETRGQRNRQFGLIFLLVMIFGVELVAGIMLLAGPPASTGPVQIISYALVTSLLVGIARAWELVGDRDTGLAASLAELAGRGRGAARAAPAAPAAGGIAEAGPEPGDQEAGERPR